MACSLVVGSRSWDADLFLLAGGESGPDEFSNKAYSIDPNSNGIVNEVADLPMTASQFGLQNSFAIFDRTAIFLAIGFGNGSHTSNNMVQWLPWNSRFESVSVNVKGLVGIDFQMGNQ